MRANPNIPRLHIRHFKIMANSSVMTPKEITKLIPCQ